MRLTVSVLGLQLLDLEVTTYQDDDPHFRDGPGIAATVDTTDTAERVGFDDRACRRS